MKNKISHIFLLLAIVQTAVYSVLDFFGVEMLMGIFEILSVPLIALFYLFKSEDINALYIIVFLMLFCGDVINTFFVGYEDLSIFLYGLVFFYYSYRVLKNMVDFKLNQILIVAIPFMFIYVSLFVWFSEFMPISEAIIVYNFFMGLLVVLSIKSFVLRRSRQNLLLLLSAVNICVITVLYAYSNFIMKTAWIESFALNNLYTLFHVSFAFYILKSEVHEAKLFALGQITES